MLDILPIMLLAVSVAIVGYLFNLFSPLSMYMNAVIVLLLYVLIYVGGSVLFKLEAFQYSKEFVPMLFSKLKRNKMKKKA